ncbi:MAG: LCP family protein [Lachnospiraceae bacterium]|nr:LCP family protein [Lachnospiraceae bacterium]
MATNSNQTRGAGQHAGNGQVSKSKMAAKQKAARKRRKIIVFAAEIIILVAMLAVLFVLFDKTEEAPIVVELPTEAESIGIASQVEESPVMKGYWNIALFGIDAENEKQLVKGARSDSIMIASINLDTGDIKLVSVYRDTYLNIGDDYYIKCNTAYSNGGGEQAVTMLNANLDLDIQDFIAIGYEGLKGVVDGLGGVYLDVDEQELKHINNYQYSIDKILKCGYTEVTKTGYQKLDGMQAAAYCRIRYRTGDDFARAASQRELIQAIEERIKEVDLATLTKVFEEVMGHVVTSLTTDDILPYLSQVSNYKIVDEGGFPESSMRTTGNIGSKGSSVIPVDLESNVVWLHEFLFGVEDYKVSDKVKEYSGEIKAETSPYLNK